MLAGKNQIRAHSISKTWNSPVPAGTGRFIIIFFFIPFTSYIKVSDRLATFSNLQWLYFARFFDIVGYQHTLTHIVISELRQLEFPFASSAAIFTTSEC